MDIRTSAALILFILAYELYWFLSHSSIMRSISRGNTLVQFMLKKSLGFVLFGIAVPEQSKQGPQETVLRQVPGD
jgi:hypothetical protein